MSAVAPLSLRDRLRLSRFLRGEGPQTGPITLTRRRVFILPTRYGWLFGLMLLVMWLGSVNYNNGLGFALTFLLGSLGMVSILHTYRNLSGLTFSAGRVAPVFAGEQACFVVNVENPGGLRDSIALQLPGAAPVACDVPRQCAVTLARLAPWRGQLSMGRFTVSTVFPLGLFRAWSHLDLRTLISISAAWSTRAPPRRTRYPTRNPPAPTPAAGAARRISPACVSIKAATRCAMCTGRPWRARTCCSPSSSAAAR